LESIACWKQQAVGINNLLEGAQCWTTKYWKQLGVGNNI